MSEIERVLEACGIPYAYNGFAPKKPPGGEFYAVILDETEDIGADALVMARRHSPVVELYDEGGPNGFRKRNELSNLLSAANIKHRMDSSVYIYNEKKYLTVYDCEDYIEKWSEENG